MMMALRALSGGIIDAEDTAPESVELFGCVLRGHLQGKEDRESRRQCLSVFHLCSLQISFIGDIFI